MQGWDATWCWIFFVAKTIPSAALLTISSLIAEPFFGKYLTAILTSFHDHLSGGKNEQIPVVPLLLLNDALFWRCRHSSSRPLCLFSARFSLGKAQQKSRKINALLFADITFLAFLSIIVGNSIDSKLRLRGCM